MLVGSSRALVDRPPDERIAAAAFVALLLFVGAWALLHVGFYKRHQVLDTPVYQRYGNAIAQGQVPYRDFAVEYPPGALPMFALPGLAKSGNGPHVTAGFRHGFEALMWLCGAAALLGMAIVFLALDATWPRVWAALAFAAVAPLALGSVVLSRFDLWPVAFTLGALAALVSGRLRLGSGLLGAGIAAKLFPAVLLPLAIVYAWRREGRQRALSCLAIALAVVVTAFAPFVAVAPGGVWHSLTSQLTRPLQIESLGAALLLAAHQAWGFGLTMESSHGSQNLVGGAPHAFAVAFSIVQILALLIIWTSFARGPATRERLLRFSAAALVAFVALGKVFSPQFMIWLIPVVPLVGGRRGLRAAALLGVGLVLTQLWFPSRYWRLANGFDARASWLVLARDLVIVALLAVLALRDRRSDAAELVADERRPAQRARLVEG